MFYGNQAIYQRWIDTQEEAINWFLDLFGLPDEDFKLTFAAGDFPDFYEPYDITSVSYTHLLRDTGAGRAVSGSAQAVGIRPAGVVRSEY